MTCQPWGSPEEVAARPSPFDSITASTGNGDLKLCYSRPSARGRVVFGGLVPFDTLWRTGANEPTTLHLSSPARIAGLDVEAGDYSLYTVPNPDQWILVVNASTTQWGLTRDEVGAAGNQFYSAYTDEVRAQEVGRVPIEIATVDQQERLVASFSPPEGESLQLWIDWETTRLVIPIEMRPSGG